MRRPHKQAANICHHSLPKCALRMFGKQTNRAKPGEQTSVVKEQEGTLSAKKLHPGQRVFIDHFVCSTQGRKFEGQGVSNRKQNARWPSKDKLFNGGCIFADAASGHIEVKFQTHFSMQEIIKSIKRHELKARDNGIIVQEHQFDNGSLFTSKSVKEHPLEEGQTSQILGTWKSPSKQKS